MTRIQRFVRGTRGFVPQMRRRIGSPGEITRPAAGDLERHLEAERRPEEALHAGAAALFASTASYHASHHRRHFTACAPREAGLPIRSACSLFKWSLQAQLDRAFETHSLRHPNEPGD